MTLKIILLFFFILLSLFSLGQKIDQSVSFREINNKAYFRIHYENDLFTSSDFYYTQGTNFEFVSPVFKKNPINHLFLNLKNKTSICGLALEHTGFTPKDIKSMDIQFDDRPFASALILKSFSVAKDSIRKARLTSSFSLGVIGPASFGKEIQTFIHQVSNNSIPQGWKNQIKNDLVLNYSISFEKQLVQYQTFLSMHANSSLQVGTLYNQANFGLNTTIGKINAPYLGDSDNTGFKLYFYTQALVNFIGYDATLQGGLLNKKSPYFLSSDEINRLTFQVESGLIFQNRSMYLECSYTAISAEFKTGQSADWGGIRIGFVF